MKFLKCPNGAILDIFSWYFFYKGIFNICRQGNLNIFNKFASGIHLPHTLNLGVLLEDNLLTRVCGRTILERLFWTLSN